MPSHTGAQRKKDAMSDIDPLILDLVEWVAARPRPYDEVMTAWRTSCPRLPVWEDAVDRGFLRRLGFAATGGEGKNQDEAGQVSLHLVFP